jgi:hypothetical protein
MTAERERLQLVDIARNVVLGKGKSVGAAAVSPFWRAIHAGCFVTCYKRLPPTSGNVWCCMSNGDYANPKPLVANIIDSAQICAAHDSRVVASIVPQAFEVCIFAPQHLWLALGNGERAIGKMRRHLHRAYMSQTSGGSHAVYLPEVWTGNWSAKGFITSLNQKAGGKASLDDVAQVYEIPCYQIADASIPIQMHDRGFFAALILQRAKVHPTSKGKNNHSIRANDVASLIRNSAQDLEPQLVVKLAYAYRALAGRQHLALRNNVEAAVLKYTSNVDSVKKAFEKDSAVAASWYLQAAAAIKATPWSCLSSTCKNIKPNAEIEKKAIEICRRAIETSNVKEQALAAHGLLVSDHFDYERYDGLLEQWERAQQRGDGWNADVMSQVVEVCLLIYWRAGDRSP